MGSILSERAGADHRAGAAGGCWAYGERPAERRPAVVGPPPSTAGRPGFTPGPGGMLGA
jgi:hypothetical protein